MFSSNFKLFILLLMEINFFKVETRSDSILDIIDTKEVEKFIAERKAGTTPDQRFLLENELDDTYDIEYEHEQVKLLDGEADAHQHNNSPNLPQGHLGMDLLFRRPNRTTPPPYHTIDLVSTDIHPNSKILKSSRNALAVTRMDYLRRDWCKTEPFIQRVKEFGCVTRTVVNRFCYGQCNSFYIPKNPKKPRKIKNQQRHRRRFRNDDEDEDIDGPAFKSCAFCKPKKYTWITVTLTCPNSTPQFRKKRIQRIKQCKCIATDLN